MNDADLDRILSTEPPVTPSAHFAASVMHAVRREAEGLAPLVFPWLRLIPALATVVALLIVAIIWQRATPATPAPAFTADPALVAVVAGTLLSWLCVHLSLRWAAR